MCVMIQYLSLFFPFVFSEDQHIDEYCMFLVIHCPYSMSLLTSSKVDLGVKSFGSLVAFRFSVVFLGSPKETLSWCNKKNITPAYGSYNYSYWGL